MNDANMEPSAPGEAGAQGAAGHHAADTADHHAAANTAVPDAAGHGHATAAAAAGRARLQRLLEWLGGSLRAPLAFCFALYFITLLNLAYLLGLPAWAALPPLLLMALPVVVLGRRPGSRTAIMNCLWVGAGVLLFAVALALTVPAWRLVMSGQMGEGFSAGPLAPLFTAALALFIFVVWIRTVSMMEQKEEAFALLQRLLSGPGLAVSLMTALVVSACFLLGLEWWATGDDARREISRRFLERGIIPPASVLLFFWGMVLLMGKASNTLVLRRLVASAEQPSAGEAQFRITLIELLGLNTEGSSLEESIKLMWRRLEESYLVPRYIVWAVPVLGFIGTVLGISLAAEGIRRIISSDSGMSGLSGELGGAIAPLGIAFDTTLVALSLSVFLMLTLTLVQRSEEGTLAALERRLRDGGGRGD